MLQIGLAVAMALVTLLQLSVLIGFRTGRFTATSDAGGRDLDRRLAGCEGRLDRANVESSKLASAVQGLIGQLDRLPNDLREIFVSRETLELHLEQWKLDRDAVWKTLGDRRRNGH